MNKLLKRFFAPTPGFWRKVRNTSGALGAGLKVVQLAGIVPGPWAPLVHTLLTVSAAVAATAQFTCSDVPAATPPTQ